MIVSPTPSFSFGHILCAINLPDELKGQLKVLQSCDFPLPSFVSMALIFLVVVVPRSHFSFLEVSPVAVLVETLQHSCAIGKGQNTE